MANEATLIIETGHAIPFTCADGTGIEKGAILTGSDPMTAATSSGSSGSAVAGIAAAEKIANDGSTKIPVFREGFFKVTASGSVTFGDSLVIFGTNKVAEGNVDSENIIGTAMETATNAQTFLMELKPISVNQA
jgi:hypothetical protein